MVTLSRDLSGRRFHQLVVNQLVGIRPKPEITAEGAVQLDDNKNDHPHERSQKSDDGLMVSYIVDSEKEGAGNAEQRSEHDHKPQNVRQAG